MDGAILDAVHQDESKSSKLIWTAKNNTIHVSRTLPHHPCSRPVQTSDVLSLWIPECFVSPDALLQIRPKIKFRVVTEEYEDESFVMRKEPFLSDIMHATVFWNKPFRRR